nr:MAG TPA: hypothetical protein [Caudoviricetes sp.]
MPYGFLYPNNTNNELTSLIIHTCYNHREF